LDFEKQLLGRMVRCWSQGEERVRVVALMRIIKIVRNSNLLEPALKQVNKVVVVHQDFVVVFDRLCL